MLDTITLAVAGEHMTALDDDALASVVGGDGFRDWIVKKIGELVFDCLSGSLDTIIGAAKAGYEDAR